MKKSLLQALAKNPVSTLEGLTEDEIANVIQYANYQYYNTDKPVFDDNIYDIIKEHLQALSPSHPILKHVGAVVNDDARKAKLPYWMGSMDKIKSDAGTVHKWMSKYDGNVVISDKLDGNSGLFYYKNGEVQLFTRGNGVEGQTITHLLPFIANIPNTEAMKKFPEFTVRGELIISKADFNGIKDLGANARNMVSGLLNSKLPNLEIAKRTQFIAYELIVPKHIPSKQMSVMKDVGFKVVTHSTVSTTGMNAESLSRMLLERRGKSEFEIDGIIVFHDEIHNRIDGANPKHAFAFKSVAMMDRAEVLVHGVEWNISKDGFMKPVVMFEPVTLGGAVVRRATGFNAKYIKDNRIAAGAKIVVMRSGDVIPYIVEVVVPAERGALPESAKYTWNETGIDIMADASNAKGEIELKSLEYFFRKVKVVGLSSGILKKLYDDGLDTVGKIVLADKKRLLTIEGFKDKLADKITSAIEERFKSIEPVVLMDSSNRFGRGLGETKIQLVVDKFPQITTDPTFIPTIQQLITVDGIQKKTAEQFVKGLAAYWEFAKANNLDKFHHKSAKKNDKNAASTSASASSTQQLFKDKAYLFTGVRNAKVEAFIKRHGGVIKKTISNNVDVLICKNASATTSKITEAKEMGIEIVTLDDFVVRHAIDLS